MFKDTLKLHLDSIQKRDLASFSSTISKNSITLIMMDGTIIDTRSKFIQFHSDWFADKDWKFNYDIMKMDETEKIAYALLAVYYEDIDIEGRPVHMKYYLNLIFKKYKEDWLLEFDQNTNMK